MEKREEHYALAEEIARAALPCPFCGERLVVSTDHHGAWAGHKNTTGPCIESVVQLHDMHDLRAWNTRASPPPHGGGAPAGRSRMQRA